MTFWEWALLVPLCVAVALPFAAMGLVAIVQILAWDAETDASNQDTRPQ